MADWAKQIAAVNLVVGDLAAGKAFYETVFGLTPLDEDEETVTFRFKDLYVFLQRGSGRAEGPSDEVRRLAENGVGQFAILVEDVDAVRAELDRRDVPVLSGPADRGWGMRTLTFADPGGTVWEIAQPLSG